MTTERLSLRVSSMRPCRRNLASRWRRCTATTIDTCQSRRPPLDRRCQRRPKVPTKARPRASGGTAYRNRAFNDHRADHDVKYPLTGLGERPCGIAEQVHRLLKEPTGDLPIHGARRPSICGTRHPHEGQRRESNSPQVIGPTSPVQTRSTEPEPYESVSRPMNECATRAQGDEGHCETLASASRSSLAPWRRSNDRGSATRAGLPHVGLPASATDSAASTYHTRCLSQQRLRRVNEGVIRS